MNTVKATACTSCLLTIKNKIPEAFYPYNIACKTHASNIENNMETRESHRQIISDKRGVRILSFDGEKVIGKVLDIHHGGFKLKSLRPMAVGENLEGMIEITNGRAFPHYVPFTATGVWVNQDEAGFRFLKIPNVRKELMDILVYQSKTRKKNEQLKKYQNSLKIYS